MTLIESVFRRASDDRVLSFQNIAEDTKVAVSEVEYLVMKALSYVRLFPPLSPLASGSRSFLLTPFFSMWRVVRQAQAHPRLA